MKKIMLAAIVALAAISGVIGYSKATTSSLNALALANIEALTRNELPPVTIECSSSDSGRCFEISSETIECPPESDYLFRYDCEFSGRASDYCEPTSC